MIDTLKKWQEHISKTDAEIKKFMGYFTHVECGLIDSIERLQEEYTKTVGELIGDIEAEWLMWYWLENEMGRKGYPAGYYGNTKPITCLEGLEELVNEGKKQ